MSILVIDNYDSFTFNLISILKSCSTNKHPDTSTNHSQTQSLEFDVLKNDELTLPLASKYDRILISPGPGLPSESGNLCQIISELAPSKIILGVCLGHQAIAQVFGAKLLQLNTPAHGVTKNVSQTINQTSLFRDLPKEFPVGLYHSWAVSPIDLPASLLVTAESADGMIMALKHTSYQVQGIQFHPESIMTSYGKQIIENWLGIFAD